LVAALNGKMLKISNPARECKAHLSQF